MYSLYIDPANDGIGLAYYLAVPILFVAAFFLAYKAGFRNGKREGERIQLQKQVDKIEK